MYYSIRSEEDAKIWSTNKKVPLDLKYFFFWGIFVAESLLIECHAQIHFTVQYELKYGISFNTPRVKCSTLTIMTVVF